MLSKAQKIRLGAFIIVGFILLLGFVIAVAGSKFVDKKDIYYITFENYSVSGLQVGGTVNYRGIKVGRVEDIKIDPKDVTKVIVTISVARGTPIKVDTEATLAFVGITGVKAIEISGGSNEAALLKPKSYIKTGSTMIDDISDRALSIAEKIDLIASNINQLTDEENRRHIAEILRQTSQILDDTRANLSTTMLSLNQVANNTAELTSGLSATIERITDAFVTDLNQLTQTTQSSMTRLTDSATGSIESVSTNANQVMNRMSDEVAGKLDILTRSATGSLDSITVATTHTLRELTRSSTSNLDSLSLTTQQNIERLVTNLSQELEVLSKSLDGSVKEISLNANALLIDTRTQLNTLGTNSNELVLNTSRQILDISTKIDRSLQKVNDIIESEEFGSIIGNLNTLSAQLTEANLKNLVGELSQTLNRAGNTISTIDRLLVRNRSNLNEILDSLREASSNLNEFSRQIADQPAIMIRGN